MSSQPTEQPDSNSRTPATEAVNEAEMPCSETNKEQYIMLERDGIKQLTLAGMKGLIPCIERPGTYSTVNKVGHRALITRVR